jgi:FAD/FMN-containing dehydrogenase
MRTTVDAVIHEIRDALGDAGVLTGPALAERTTSDWSEADAALPGALVLPRTPAEVAAALRILHTHHCAVVVQGGLTGLAGGANPRPGEVALSLTRLDRIEALDAIGGTAVVQAGVTLERLQSAAEETGWFFPLDLGARGSCQLGGNAATNAGGNRVLRFGMMRNLVLGLEVALPDGTLLTMLDRVIKNNAGFDLKHLFIGTEGTLGVVTRLSLQLVPRPLHQPTALCAVPDFASALALLRDSKSRLPGLTAFELMWSDFFEASCRAQRKASPFGQAHPLYVLIEGFAASEEVGNASIEHLLEHAFDRGLVTDAVVAQSGSQAGQLWAYREGVSELLSVCKPLAAFDVSVATTRMDELVTQLRACLTQAFPSQQHLFFGHLGDGNLHLISGNFAGHDDVVRAEEMVYAIVGEFQGSISAEHGIGTVKRPFLHHSRTPEELRLMQQLKGWLDPRNILNPGRVLPELDRA